MKKTVLLVAALLIFSVGTAFAGDVKLDVKCPSGIRANSALWVPVDFYAWNDSCTGTVPVTRAMVGLVGNSGGTLGNAGIWGPFNRTVSFSIPACSQTPLTYSVKIADAVPVSLVNTMAMVVISLVDSAGREYAGGSCMVNVWPAL